VPIAGNGDKKIDEKRDEKKAKKTLTEAQIVRRRKNDERLFGVLAKRLGREAAVMLCEFHLHVSFINEIS
jgi:hypothetical protein